MHHPIQCAQLDVSSKYDHDGSRAWDTRHDFLNRYADDEVLVLGTHFAAPTAGRIISHSDSWQFQVDGTGPRA